MPYSTSKNKNVFLGSIEFGFRAFGVLSRDHPDDWFCIIYNDEGDPRSVSKQIQKYCEEKKIEFIKLRAPGEIVNKILELQADFLLVCGYYNILPESVTSSGTQVVGIHHSLLPKYRGGAPLVWQIINGEKEVGSSLFCIDAEMDGGDIICQVKTKLTSEMLIADCISKIEIDWLKILPTVWKKFTKGKLTPTPQLNDEASYCVQRMPEDGRIDWMTSASKIDLFIRAQFDPYPGAFTILSDRKIFIRSWSIFDKPIYGRPGKVFGRFRNGIVICCGGDTAIIVNAVRIENFDCSAVEIFKLGMQL